VQTATPDKGLDCAFPASVFAELEHRATTLILFQCTACPGAGIKRSFSGCCQKQCETNPSKEQKTHTAVSANKIIRRKIAITSFTKVTTVSTTNASHEENRWSECHDKVLYVGPTSARNVLTKLMPDSCSWRNSHCTTDR